MQSISSLYNPHVFTIFPYSLLTPSKEGRNNKTQLGCRKTRSWTSNGCRKTRSWTSNGCLGFRFWAFDGTVYPILLVFMPTDRTCATLQTLKLNKPIVFWQYTTLHPFPTCSSPSKTHTSQFAQALVKGTMKAVISSLISSTRRTLLHHMSWQGGLIWFRQNACGTRQHLVGRESLVAW